LALCSVEGNPQRKQSPFFRQAGYAWNSAHAVLAGVLSEVALKNGAEAFRNKAGDLDMILSGSA